MKRYQDCGVIEMAQGAAEPAWLLPDVRPRFATWSLCGGRPFGCDDDCARWHAGIDLIDAKHGALVVAPEEATIVALDRGWSKDARAVYLRTKTGLFLALGGTIHGSGQEWGRKAGDELRTGDPVGRVLGSYGMIHFETYVDDGRRTHNSRWYVGDPPPDGLLNPLNYIQRAAGLPATLETDRQRQQALLDLGYAPDHVDQAWGERSKSALRKAQADLGLQADGIWGPNTEKAIREALNRAVEAQTGDCEDDGPCPARPKGARPAQENVLDAPPANGKPGLSNTAVILLGVAGAAALVGGAAFILGSRAGAPQAP